MSVLSELAASAHGESLVSSDKTNAARRLFASGPDPLDAKVVAAHSVAVFDLLSTHLARLLGELGIRTLYARSLALSSATIPGLLGPIPATTHPKESLRACLEHQAPDGALTAAVHVFMTFTALLERFIGSGLVESLLHEVWPGFFPATGERDTK